MIRVGSKVWYKGPVVVGKTDHWELWEVIRVWPGAFPILLLRIKRRLTYFKTKCSSDNNLYKGCPEKRTPFIPGINSEAFWLKTRQDYAVTNTWASVKCCPDEPRIRKLVKQWNRASDVLSEISSDLEKVGP